MGRPRKFDEEQVLVEAMFTFWQKGYEATSLKDLENATRLPTSSLYNSFGNKEDLFIKSLEYYFNTIVRKRIETYLEMDDPIEGIYAFFTSCFSQLPDDHADISCLVVNSSSEMPTRSERARKCLLKHEKMFQQSFFKAIERAKEGGQIAPHVNSKNLAVLLGVSLNGLLVSSKAINDKQRMVNACKKTLSVIFQSI